MLKGKYKSVKYVFFDIDDTIAHSNLGYPEVGYFEYILMCLVCRAKNVGSCEALEMVLNAENNYPCMDPFEAACELEIQLDAYRAELAAIQGKYLDIYEDAVELIKALKGHGYDLFITSNNNKSRAFSVLKTAGIAGWESSCYFSKTYGPDTTGFTKNKVDFYEEVISDGNFRPEEMLVIGDNEEADSRIPEAAGIKHTVVVDRSKNCKNSECFTVQDLRELMI